MRFSTPSVSSKDGKGSSNQLSPRHRKKHKRLDAICEREYSKNHGDANENCESGIRRSSRVRRAPVLLDNSPPPPKKRRKLGNNRNAVSGGEKSVKSSPAARDSEDSGDPGIWKSRLRTRGANKLSFRVKEERVTPRGKRRIFYESNGDAEIELGVVKVEPEVVGKYTVVKSKRPGRIKATIGSGSEAKVIDSIVVKDEETVVEELEVDDDLDKEIELQEEDDLDDPTENEIADDDDDDDNDDGDDDDDDDDEDEEDEVQLVETEVPLQSEDECVRDDTVKTMDDPEATTEPLKEIIEELDSAEDQSDHAELVTVTENGSDFMDAEETQKQPEQVEMQTDVMDVVASPAKETEPTSCDNENGVKKIELDKESRGKDSDAKVESVKFPTRDLLGKPRIKEGRRCGLCGGGLDGKPPKPLAQDTGESDNELYCGSSGSEDPNYDIWDGFGDEPSWLGRLLGPINDRYGIAGTWLHQHCAVWSPEVYFAGLGRLKNVRAALCRGRVLKCTRCGRPGATIGCRVDRCPKTYHLPCARANGCIFDHRKFLIACTDHRHLFQPHGIKKLAIIKKVKARKMKLELRKLANEASRKDIEAEEKWFENCGEDEEFLKRESKRLHRDVVRIAPVYIGGKDSESGKLFEGWESVAGLQNVIQCMKEVVILPLLYPEFFDNLGLTPPRGVLLHGYPGTGKTLVVRALIGACARGDKRIAYFARKGADCLGKYVGDAERQLRLLFQVAEKCQPSIIFFDEIDGLAPCRTRRQDQTHSSVVSTLLALMDGLKSRGSVIVIGATNRPDAVDPALRRPGRFDREIYFPLPSLKDRAAILSLHTQKWPKQVTGPLLEWIASKTVGFAGADLQALCTQAAIIGLKRNFPLQEILSAAEKLANNGKRLPLPNFVVEERDWLEALSRSPPPCSRREAGIAASDVASSPLPCHLIPCLLRPLVTLLASLHLDERILLPDPLSKAACTIKSVIISTMAKKNLQGDCWWSFLDDFIKEAGVAGEIKRGLLDSGILPGDDCIAASDDFNGKADDNNLNAKFKLCMKRNGMSFLEPRKASGFRVLIAGNPRSGQRHLASCLVHCFVGNGEIKKVDLATISQQGHGDVVQGLTDILRECAGVSSITVFMPRIDLWAVETTQQVMEESDSVSVKDNSGLRHNHAAENKHASGLHKRKTADKFGDQSVTRRVSSAWSLFVEQVESIRVSTSLTILGTSELPCELLPIEIREFFMKRTLSSQPTLMEHSIPRFVVQVDGDFDHDSVIDVSAAKLSRDVVQHLTQLLHQRSHTHKTSSEKYKVYDFFEDHTSVVNTTARCDEESVPKTLPPNARVSKVRSNLHLAISSFGYQIVRYPHFAELCWVTSKLKEGPSAEVSGPWKGWPFNSCIVRSTNSLEEIVVGSRSVKVKSKEKSGLVRGLIAVGLSAYNGVYSSLRDVSFEVRKVLELIVTQVNEKIKAGKDRYQYVRLLSQVAYLEDKVNSWVYSLQSLEIDAPVTVENARINSDNAPKSQVQSGEGKPYATIQLNESTELGDKKVLPIDLNKVDGDLSHFNSDGSQQMVVSAENSVPEPVDNSEHKNQPAEKILTEQNGRHPGPLLSENNVYHSRVDKDSVVLEHSNGFASGVVSEDGSRPDSNSNLNEPSSEETESDDVCLYRCCSECLKGLLGLTKKVLIRRCKLDRNRLTVDDVHDVVASLSVDLVSAVRKVYIDGKADSPADTKQRTCHCDASQNGIFVPVDCGCHSESSLNSRSQAEMGFIFRNGVLVRFDPGMEVSSFHCRFEALCLCSLIDSIQTSVQRDS